MITLIKNFYFDFFWFVNSCLQNFTRFSQNIWQTFIKYDLRVLLYCNVFIGCSIYFKIVSNKVTALLEFYFFLLKTLVEGFCRIFKLKIN